MNAQENIELVRRGYAAFKSGHIEELLSLCADDIDWTVPSVEGLPFGGRRNGIRQVGEFFAELAAAEEIIEFTQENYAVQDDRVVVTGRNKARVTSTGRTFETPYVHFFTVRNGKVQAFAEYFDTAVVARAYRRSARAGA